MHHIHIDHSLTTHPRTPGVAATDYVSASFLCPCLVHPCTNPLLTTANERVQEKCSRPPVMRYHFA